MTTDPRIDLELSIFHAASETRALIAPNRGGMATGFEVRGRPIFFMDRESFVDASKNVRGGAPVLFPTPGKLTGDRWSRAGKSGALKQHGFARNLAWAVKEQRDDALTLRLESDASTRASYPWEFAIDLTYRVGERALHADARIENRSSEPMPFGFGFHPYFRVHDKGTFSLETGATRALDNVTKQIHPFDRRSLDLRTTEVDLHLLDHTTRGIVFAYDDVRAVTIDGSAAYSHWVLWTLPGRDFVCVEPWTCPPDAMNQGERLIELEPGASIELALAYVVEPR